MKNQLDIWYWINIISLPINLLLAVALGKYETAIAWFVALTWFLIYTNLKNNS